MGGKEIFSIQINNETALDFVGFRTPTERGWQTAFDIKVKIDRFVA